MNIGDEIESGIWITGEESKEMRSQYEEDVCNAISDICLENGFTCGPVIFTELHPMDENVPEVPDHVHGERVRLLVGESVVIEKAFISTGSFVNNLEYDDLQRLRAILRKYRPLTDMECDEMIEELGPDAALDTLRH